MARKPHRPTTRIRRMVRLATAGGIVQRDIAGALGIDEKTLRKYYADEIDNGAAVANAAVVAALFRTATAGGREGTTAAIWWTKCRMGWSEYKAPPPPPKPPKPPAKGKKELAEEMAGTALGEAPGWGSLLRN